MREFLTSNEENTEKLYGEPLPPVLGPTNKARHLK